MTDHRNFEDGTNWCAVISDLQENVFRVARCAQEASDVELGMAAAAMADLLAVASMFSDDDSTQERAAEILQFCQQEGVPALTAPSAEQLVRGLREKVEERWNDGLALLEPAERFQCQPNVNSCTGDEDEWNESIPPDATDTNSDCDATDVTPTVDIDGILMALGQEEAQRNLGADNNEKPATPSAEAPVALASIDDEVPQIESIDDPEMMAAFADDAQQCLAEMEASVLRLETDTEAAGPLKHFCRQLHTLKGAAGTVGLPQLASFLHELESYVEKTPGNEVDVDRLLAGVDAVRAQIASPGSAAETVDALKISADVTPSLPQSEQQQTLAGGHPTEPRLSPSVVVPPNDAEKYVRIEASRLERLMDLLAELVMLRNRRDTYVKSLHSVHNELNHCSSRTRSLSSAIEFPTIATTTTDHSLSVSLCRQAAQSRLIARSLNEVSGDTAELSRSLKEVMEPLSADNSAVSHLIGQFRQELMELRRLPVSGLFQRLQRAIREAAKAEGKHVEIECKGEGARAERAVQERLFEPLLHLVRNAVSHGIQSEDDRIRAGKPARGRITLTAHSDAASLCIEVKDDGCGLNDAALETRGRELGLLPWGEPVDQTRLWKLIFHPGFSTKSSVSEISGRGVGMDVVDSWVRRLRGRIEVESVVGEGTTFRIQIPLRSAVEHAMVVRYGQQLFALPMHTISGTSDARISGDGASNETPSHRVVSLGTLLGCQSGQTSQRCHVTLRDTKTPAAHSNQPSSKHIAIAVDAIIGVEEVVVRSLPALMQKNDLVSGVTLSGRAETVLLLDARRLLELSRNTTFVSDDAQPESLNGGKTTVGNEQERKRILVVDDSVVVRSTLSKKLRALGYGVEQASHGRQALELLKHYEFGTVVTDIDMPVMNGLELLHEIRRQRPLQSLPVTVLTSREEESVRLEMPDEFPTAVLTKPVTDDTIQGILDHLQKSAVLSASHSNT